MRDRISPDIPPPRLPPAGDSNIEWAQIDRIGDWKAIISPFGAIDQIPAQHKAVWAWAWGAILVKVQSAVSDLDLDRALMWFLFLPQALCRKPRRGGVQGRGFINKRFNALANQKWGDLVDQWESDLEFENAKQLRRERQGQRPKD